jgi:RNA polymerase sigma-70 factor (ECF subfamily)
MSRNRNASDYAIIKQILDGDVNAFDVLLSKYYDHVANVVKNHVPYDNIEEVAHEVFVRVYQSLPTFQHKSHFTHWLSKIAVRTCYDFSRKQYRNREMTMSSLSEQQQQWLETAISDQSSRSFYESETQKEVQEVLEWALNTLSPEDKMVVELIYFQELSGKEAAELLGWSVPKVKMRSLRARKKLRQLLTKKRQR